MLKWIVTVLWAVRPEPDGKIFNRLSWKMFVQLLFFNSLNSWWTSLMKNKDFLNVWLSFAGWRIFMASLLTSLWHLKRTTWSTSNLLFIRKALVSITKKGWFSHLTWFQSFLCFFKSSSGLIKPTKLQISSLFLNYEQTMSASF